MEDRGCTFKGRMPARGRVANAGMGHLVRCGCVAVLLVVLCSACREAPAIHSGDSASRNALDGGGATEMEQRSPGDAESEASVDVESGESKCSCKCGVCEAGRSSNEPPCHVCDEGDGGWWRECPCIECWGGTSRNDRCGCGGPGSCVNGQWFDPGQECSDGNTVAWDGCTVGWATERQVNSFSMGRQEAPRVEALRGGGFVVVWTSRPWAASDLAQDGDDCGVVGRVFDGNGVPKGNEFVVNTVVEGWCGFRKFWQ
jgi:hypothetical protein